MKIIAITLINIYRAYISPFKGFRCAHAALHQGDSCSLAVKKIVEAHGVWGGYRQVRQRFDDCQFAYQTLCADKQKDKEKEDSQNKRKGYDCCDLGASTCDGAHCLSKKSCNLPDLPCDCSLF